jgi:hypothetical protein
MRTRLLFAVVVAVAVPAVFAQGPPAAPKPPEKPKNLLVLPKDMSREQVINIMKAFTAALGVRCQHCHVAKDPADFSTFDFASDEKETKKVARSMMVMTTAINEEFLPRTGRTSLVRVQCVTCHRGVPRPEPLADVLVATAQKSGVEAAQKEYQELREKHGVSGGYDFSARSLSTAAGRLADAGNVDAAIRLHEFTLTVVPPSASIYTSLSDLYLKKGDRVAARAQIEKAILLQPEDPALKKRLQDLAGPAK